MSSRKAELLMTSVSLAWGSSYLLMKVGLDSIAPFNLIALRFGIAFVCMTVVFFKKFRSLNRKTLGKGVLMGAFFYAIYILVLDKIAKKDDTLLISIIQLGVASLLGTICMLLFETPSLPKTPVQWGAVICLGLICSAYGFIVQPIAQKYAAPERIGLIFSLEPVFSAILSYIFLHEILEVQGYVGAAMIFLSVLLSEVVKDMQKSPVNRVGEIYDTKSHRYRHQTNHKDL